MGVLADLKWDLRKREELRMRIIFLASTTGLQIVSFTDIRNTLRKVNFMGEVQKIKRQTCWDELYIAYTDANV